MKRIPLSRGVYLLPSLFTTGSLFFGFFSIVRSINGDFGKATLALFACGVFDMLDGRLARLTKTESDFGIEYDSLVDLVSFGLAPAILLYTWHLQGLGRFGWLVVFFYFACGALRLARYNVQIETIEKKKFQGLPIPSAALLIASFVIFYEGGYGPDFLKNALSLGLPTLLAPLMVSKIRYRSFKDLDFQKSRNTFYWLVVVIGVILVIASEPKLMLFLFGLVYLFSGPIEELVLVLKKNPRKIRKIPLLQDGL